VQDHELTHAEFGEDLETDAFEFDMESWVERPQDEATGISAAQAAFDAAAAFQKAKSVQSGAASHRKHSGSWLRRGNTVVQFGI
jgi:hypothetical protein